MKMDMDITLENRRRIDRFRIEKYKEEKDREYISSFDIGINKIISILFIFYF